LIEKRSGTIPEAPLTGSSAGSSRSTEQSCEDWPQETALVAGERGERTMDLWSCLADCSHTTIVTRSSPSRSITHSHYRNITNFPHPKQRYLTDLCVPVSDVSAQQHLRYATRRLLVVPRCRLSTLGPRAFSVAGRRFRNLYQTRLERSRSWQGQLQTSAEDAFIYSVPKHL